MLRHLARSILATTTTHIQAPGISETTHTHAALALAAAWRRAASNTSGGSGGDSAATTAAPNAAGAVGAATAETTPATPPRVAEMAALFTCNVCGEAMRGERETERAEKRQHKLSSLPPAQAPACPFSTPLSLPAHTPDHRSAHGFSRAAYERGVVIVTCSSCSSRHLLADRLGWFGEAGAVDRFLAERGDREGGFLERAVAGGDAAGGGAGGTLEVTAEELDGWTRKA